MITDKDIVAIEFSSLPCSLETFTIFGAHAELGWFVDMISDTCPDDCNCYGCHEMHAVERDLNDVHESLEGFYKGLNSNMLTDDDIRFIQRKLVDILYVGDCDCGWCS